jgi:hypothetical protein
MKSPRFGKLQYFVYRGFTYSDYAPRFYRATRLPAEFFFEYWAPRSGWCPSHNDLPWLLDNLEPLTKTAARKQWPEVV